jgi:hypothetical protein
MKIETKFNVNDSVCFLHEHKAVKSSVHSIKIDLNNDGSSNKVYFFFVGDNKECVSCNEPHIYKSKDELIKSL